MSHTTHSAVPSLVLLLTAGVFGCGSDLLLPEQSGSGDNVALSKVDGDEQIGTVGEQLLQPLVVQVMTERQEPAPERLVAFKIISEQGVVAPDTATTNSQGEAIARLTLGIRPGPHVVVASLVGGDSSSQITEFHALARSAAPDTLSPLSPLAQPGRKSREASTPPEVRVVDRYGNPVQDAAVNWDVTAGGGSVESPVTRTDAEGKATNSWMLGNGIGIQKLNASVGSVAGSPVTFTASVLF